MSDVPPGCDPVYVVVTSSQFWSEKGLTYSFPEAQGFVSEEEAKKAAVEATFLTGREFVVFPLLAADWKKFRESPWAPTYTLAG